MGSRIYLVEGDFELRAEGRVAVYEPVIEEEVALSQSPLIMK
jgi:hypothetical protein